MACPALACLCLCLRGSASALPLSCPTTLRDPFLQPGIRRIAALIQAPQGRTTWPEDLQPVRPTLHEVPTYLTLL